MTDTVERTTSPGRLLRGSAGRCGAGAGNGQHESQEQAATGGEHRRDSMAPSKSYSHPFARAMRAASTLLRPPSLPTASDR